MPKTVLIVEDDTALLESLGSLLRRHGYAVLQAADGESAAAVLNKAGGQVDLAIIDMVLPQLSGAELIGMIRRRGTSHIKVLAITGLLKQVFLETALQIGAHAILRKPISDAVWLGTVRSLLGDEPATAQAGSAGASPL